MSRASARFNSNLHRAGAYKTSISASSPTFPMLLPDKSNDASVRLVDALSSAKGPMSEPERQLSLKASDSFCSSARFFSSASSLRVRLCSAEMVWVMPWRP